MKCLTPREISRWMTEHGHDDESDMRPVISFYAPTNFGGLECFVDCVLREVFVRGEVLLVITDTDLEHARHLRVIEGLRCLAGEKRSLKKAPGFLFSETEWQDAMTLFSFAASCMWKCYLWGESDQLTLFNWEGEIFDVWPGNRAGRKVVLGLLKNFKLKRIIRHAKTRGK
jgi:hypothetical protein